MSGTAPRPGVCALQVAGPPHQHLQPGDRAFARTPWPGVDIATLVTVSAKWHFGNAGVDGAERRGWLVGAFMEPDDVRMSKDLEIKWGVHSAGDRREAWFEEEQRTTILILVRGRFRIDLSVGSALLAEAGDYAMWGPRIAHSWRSEEDSVVVTVRWPAVP